VPWIQAGGAYRETLLQTIEAPRSILRLAGKRGPVRSRVVGGAEWLVQSVVRRRRLRRRCAAPHPQPHAQRQAEQQQRRAAHDGRQKQVEPTVRRGRLAWGHARDHSAARTTRLSSGRDVPSGIELTSTRWTRRIETSRGGCRRGRRAELTVVLRGARLGPHHTLRPDEGLVVAHHLHERLLVADGHHLNTATVHPPAAEPTGGKRGAASVLCFRIGAESWAPRLGAWSVPHRACFQGS
jgi:hypothetical protein